MRGSKVELGFCHLHPLARTTCLEEGYRWELVRELVKDRRHHLAAESRMGGTILDVVVHAAWGNYGRGDRACMQYLKTTVDLTRGHTKLQ